MRLRISRYSHARAIGAGTGLSFGTIDKLFNPETVFSFHYASTIVDRLFRDVLDPVGFIGAGIGAWVAWHERRWCEVLGLAGFLAYLVIVSEGNLPHDYYQLTIMPVAPMLATTGVLAMSVWFGRGSRRRAQQALMILMALAVVSTFVRSVSAHSWYEYDAADVELCSALSSVTEPPERVVIAGGRNPWLLFCLDRKGWLVDPEALSRASVDEMRREGASLVVVETGIAGAEDAQRVAEAVAPRVLTRKVTAFRLP